MANDVLGMVVPKDEQEEIKEFVATLASSSERRQSSAFVKRKCL